MPWSKAPIHDINTSSSCVGHKATLCLGRYVHLFVWALFVSALSKDEKTTEQAVQTAEYESANTERAEYRFIQLYGKVLYGGWSRARQLRVKSSDSGEYAQQVPGE